MHDILLEAAVAARERGWFDPHALFRERVGRTVVYPLGLGSAIEKALREGYLVSIARISGRRRRLAFTQAGLALVAEIQEKRRPEPRAAAARAEW